MLIILINGSFGVLSRDVKQLFAAILPIIRAFGSASVYGWIMSGKFLVSFHFPICHQFLDVLKILCILSALHASPIMLMIPVQAT